MIKALFFDLDGTLLNSGNRIAESTIKALKECRDKGIKIFTATGRPPLLKYLLPLGPEELELLNDGGVFYNGACILQGTQKQYFTVDEKIIDTVKETFKNYPDINLVLQMKNEKHSFNYYVSEKDLPSWGITKDQLLPYNTIGNTDTVKLYIFSDNYSKELVSLYNALEPLIGMESSMYLTFKNKTIEIVGKNISKKSGVEGMLKFMGISKSEAAVFGDDMNDIEMLSSFPNSIAMGNACDQVKAVSRHITYDNNSDGIYFALKEYLGLIGA